MELAQDLCKQVLKLALLRIAAIAGLSELRVQQPDQAPLFGHLLLRQQLPPPLYAPQMLLHILPDLCHRQDLLQARRLIGMLYNALVSVNIKSSICMPTRGC